MKRYWVPLAAAAVLGAMLPASPGAAADKPAFSGYSADAWAAPVKIEIYEPTIPVPATPQLELELAYSKVEADSGSSKARASWLWPGDPVGEGLKTFVTALGLPEQLGEAGYPVQVNAAQPSGEPAQADEPFPGAVMRSSATDRKTVAQVGFSPDGNVGNGEPHDGGEGTPGVPGLPAVPGLPGTAGAGPDALQQFGQAITGALGGDKTQAAAAEDPAAPGLPPELAALVDVEGYTSSSQTVSTDAGVVSTARSALGDVSLLGGIIELDGLVVTSTSSSNGKAGDPDGRARIGGITIAGQEFSFGPDGLVAAGQKTPIPGLPDQAAAALEQLGVRLELPKAQLEHKGDLATSDLGGLRVEIDTAVLRDKLDALPLDDLVGAVPDQAGQLKSLLQAVAGLSPRVVVTLGNAGTSVDTVQGLTFPTDIPDNDPGAAAAPAGGSGGGAGASAGGGSVPAAAPAAGSDAPAAATDDLGDAALAGSGLPALYTIPGAILVGGLALGALGGTWLRRAGVLALGGAGSCSHGLDRGLPDLRKAR
ncbi:choice-of-anchor P family protein [Nocardioides conyzicola]|uniref:Choice-of-anchor G family protein n=1 Tax=Nocardioides conyzicola TaxID=1651781 RepID=A0ABP8XIS4_9ACTN